MIKKGNTLQFLFIIIAIFLSSCDLKRNSAPSAKAEKWETVAVNGTNKLSNYRADANSAGLDSNPPENLEAPADTVKQTLLREYGAVFVARGGAVPPPTIIFKNAVAVSSWQSEVASTKETVGGIGIELQTAAMKALMEAIKEARQEGQTITPRGSDAARRSYEDTEKLWTSRVDPGLAHWVAAGNISHETAVRIRSLPPFEQVDEIFKLESQGMYFSKDFSKSIMYSVAPPGSSQHLSMLALDVAEHENLKVREILARHGWFQTVRSDMPHFTFLGVEEKELPELGLKRITLNGRVFWLPADEGSLYSQKSG